MSERQSGALVNLANFTVEHLNVTTVDGYDAVALGDSSLNMEMSFGVATLPGRDSEFGLRLLIRLQSDSERPTSPYVIDVGIRAAFDTPVKIHERAVPGRIVQNALLILYGLLRGIIATATSNFAHGSFILPSVVFDDLVRRAEQDPESPIVPDIGNVPPDLPGVPEFFRMRYAVEDFEQGLRAVPPHERGVAIDAFNAVVTRLNEMPAEPEAMAALLDAAEHLVVVAGQISAPVAPLLVRWAEAINASLQRVAHAQSAAAAKQ